MRRYLSKIWTAISHVSTVVFIGSVGGTAVLTAVAGYLGQVYAEIPQPWLGLGLAGVALLSFTTLALALPRSLPGLTSGTTAAPAVSSQSRGTEPDSLARVPEDSSNLANHQRSVTIEALLDQLYSVPVDALRDGFHIHGQYLGILTVHLHYGLAEALQTGELQIITLGGDRRFTPLFTGEIISESGKRISKLLEPSDRVTLPISDVVPGSELVGSWFVNCWPGSVPEFKWFLRSAGRELGAGLVGVMNIKYGRVRHLQASEIT